MKNDVINLQENIDTETIPAIVWSQLSNEDKLKFLNYVNSVKETKHLNLQEYIPWCHEYISKSPVCALERAQLCGIFICDDRFILINTKRILNSFNFSQSWIRNWFQKSKFINIRPTNEITDAIISFFPFLTDRSQALLWQPKLVNVLFELGDEPTPFQVFFFTLIINPAIQQFSGYNSLLEVLRPEIGAFSDGFQPRSSSPKPQHNSLNKKQVNDIIEEEENFKSLKLIKREGRKDSPYESERSYSKALLNVYAFEGYNQNSKVNPESDFLNSFGYIPPAFDDNDILKIY